MVLTQKGIIILGADGFQIEMHLIDYFYGNPFPSLLVRKEAEVSRESDADRIVEKDIGWVVYKRGETEPKGIINVNSYPVGHLLLYTSYDTEDWSCVEQVIEGVLGLLSEKGFEQTPYKGKLPIEPNDLIEVEYQIDDTFSHRKSTTREVIVEEINIALLMNRKRMREFYIDYSPLTAKEIIDAIPKAIKKYPHERWGPRVISQECNVEVTTVGRYLKAFWLAGVHEINGIPIPYRPKYS